MSTIRKRMSAAERREVIETAASAVFAEHGYAKTSMDEIARRSHVSVPVIYDHFASKQALHTHLLERHYAELRELWRIHLAGEDPAAQRIPRALDAWFAYVREHPYAWRMLFADTTGDPAIRSAHNDIIEHSRAAIMPLLAAELAPGTHRTPVAAAPAVELELAWESVRALLQGLAAWWHEHPDVARHQIVDAAMNALWVGFERVLGGERWR